MTLIGSIVALVVASGVIVASLNASTLAAKRIQQASLELEAIVRAEAILARADVDLPLRHGLTSGKEGEFAHWSMDIQNYDHVKGIPSPLQLTASVTIFREEIAATRTLTVLRLRWERAR